MRLDEGGTAWTAEGTRCSARLEVRASDSLSVANLGVPPSGPELLGATIEPYVADIACPDIYARGSSAALLSHPATGRGESVTLSFSSAIGEGDSVHGAVASGEFRPGVKV